MHARLTILLLRIINNISGFKYFLFFRVNSVDVNIAVVHSCQPLIVYRLLKKVPRTTFLTEIRRRISHPPRTEGSLIDSIVWRWFCFLLYPYQSPILCDKKRNVDKYMRGC